ncbi:MAG TPA: hypothetical protein PKW16_11710 [Treponemataceae bacterium]|nr:hypothetical protein [Treponemataceae bacterium]
MNDKLNADLIQLLSTIELSEIIPTSLNSARLGANLGPGENVDLELTQAFADGDPVRSDPIKLVFRPKFDILVKKGEAHIFSHTSTFVIVFTIANADVFDSLWKDDELKNVFLSKQITKILWPIFRQHVLDGMTRLGLPPVTLQWIR